MRISDWSSDVCSSDLGGGRRLSFVELDGQTSDAPRRVTGIGEFDRVLGGGLVAGSATLIGGDPGIGQSTVLLQAVAGLSGGSRCAYVSGEAAVDQVRLGGRRLGGARPAVEMKRLVEGKSGFGRV